MRFRTRPFYLSAAFAASLAGTPAASQPVFEACGQDLERYCSDVEPGHGRLLACLYAREAVISDGCDAAIGDWADILDLFFERLRYVVQECGRDIRAQCGDVALGQGRVFTCLYDSRHALSDGCRAVVDDVQFPRD